MKVLHGGEMREDAPEVVAMWDCHSTKTRSDPLIFYRESCRVTNSRDSQSMKTRTRGESWRLRG